MPEATPHIGTLREKPLHASLKHWYSRPNDQIEVPVDGFVIDLVRDGLLIEIQTRGFGSMKKKVGSLLEGGHQMRIVHPIAVDRWIVKIDHGGSEIDRRMSPKHGHPSDIFSELVSFPELISHPGFELEVLLTTEEEYRRHDPDRAWRRKGWTVVERRLIEVLESIPLSDPDDLVGLLPADMSSTFTTADIKTSLRRPLRAAQQMAYCLNRMGAIEIVGKVGNSIEYRLKSD